MEILGIKFDTQFQNGPVISIQYIFGSLRFNCFKLSLWHGMAFPAHPPCEAATLKQKLNSMMRPGPVHGVRTVGRTSYMYHKGILMWWWGQAVNQPIRGINSPKKLQGKLADWSWRNQGSRVNRPIAIFGSMNCTDASFQQSHMGVSYNRDTPKSSNGNFFLVINHPILGSPVLRNTHMMHTMLGYQDATKTIMGCASVNDATPTSQRNRTGKDCHSKL